MKKAEEILKPYVEKILRHTGIVEKDNALIAMNRFADQFRLPDVMQWVAIEDEVPEDYKRVLYCDERDNSLSVGYFVRSQSPANYVKYWMELPQPPCV